MRNVKSRRKGKLEGLCEEDGFTGSSAGEASDGAGLPEQGDADLESFVIVESAASSETAEKEESFILIDKSEAEAATSTAPEPLRDAPAAEASQEDPQAKPVTAMSGANSDPPAVASVVSAKATEPEDTGPSGARPSVAELIRRAKGTESDVSSRKPSASQQAQVASSTEPAVEPVPVTPPPSAAANSPAAEVSTEPKKPAAAIKPTSDATVSTEAAAAVVSGSVSTTTASSSDMPEWKRLMLEKRQQKAAEAVGTRARHVQRRDTCRHKRVGFSVSTPSSRPRSLLPCAGRGSQGG